MRFPITTWTMIRANEESLELRFFARDRLPDMMPGERRAVELYAEYLKSGKFQLR